MKILSEWEVKDTSNAWGNVDRVATQIREVEASDVGVLHHNHGGHGHKTYIMTLADVEREIMEYRDTSGWTCWTFRTESKAPSTIPGLPTPTPLTPEALAARQQPLEPMKPTYTLRTFFGNLLGRFRGSRCLT
jgi:hypothetical protein